MGFIWPFMQGGPTSFCLFLFDMLSSGLQAAFVLE